MIIARVRRAISPPLLNHGALNSFRLAHLLGELKDRGIVVDQPAETARRSLSCLVR
jgi:hypothetical protein